MWYTNWWEQKHTYHHLHPVQSSQSVGGVCAPLWLLLTSDSSGCFHYCGCWQMEVVETVSGPLLRYESILRKTQLRKNNIPHVTFHSINHTAIKGWPEITWLTNTLWLGSAPVWLCCVDAGRHLMAANLETWITVEVRLTSRMDVCHRHSAALRRQWEWAGQQKG